MNPWINYHHLLYFKTIAEEGSVSRAAEKLRLGQPTLSAQLKQFEDNLGVQLFMRQHKKLILTEQGKVALDYARNIFKMGNEMYEVLQDKVVPSRTSLHIGALDSISKQLLLQITKAAYKISPCNVTVIEGRADEMLRELSAHRIDLFITNFLPTSGEIKGYYHRSVIKKPVSIYGATKFKPLRKNFPQSLENQKFILPTYDSRLRYDLEHWFKTKGLVVDIVAETQDIALKKMMAIEGLGLVPAASHTVMRQIISGDLVEIGSLDNVNEELFLVTAERRIANPVALEIMKTFEV